MPDKIVRLKAKCPICGATFEYIEGGYKPDTCHNFTCVYRFKHKSIFEGKETHGKIKI